MCTISPGLLLCRPVLRLHGILKRIMCTHSRASFSKLSRWLEDARALGSPHLVTVLVGNKSDREEEEREVEWAEASRWAAEHGADDLFTSQNAAIRHLINTLAQALTQAGIVLL